jgi:hypothetical protein
MSGSTSINPLICKDCGLRSLAVRKSSQYNVNLCVPCLIERKIQNKG